MSQWSEDDGKLSMEMGLRGGFPPFIELMGITFEPLDDAICVKLAMRKELSLNHEFMQLHGGAIAAVMDVVGGTVVSWEIMKEVNDASIKEKAIRLNRVRTIDLRIDFLQPGKGKEFTATGSVLRGGSKVSVARMDMHNEKGKLIAAGTGTYRVG